MKAIQQVKVLYVAGMPRGGTTLVDLMLGQLAGHAAVGELFYVWLTGLSRNRLCGCGRTFADCTFWQMVGEEAFGGWHNVDAQQMLQLTNEVDKTLRLPLIVAPKLRPQFNRRLAEYQDTLTRLYAAIAKIADSPVVVDSSKRPSMAYILNANPSIDLRMIHVMRDPRGVAHSWSKEVKLPDQAGARGYLKRRSPRLIARRWTSVHLLLFALTKRGVPTAFMRYEDIAQNPQAACAAAAAVFDAAPSADGFAFLDGHDLHLTDHHTVAGGRIRFTEGPLKVKLDEQWRADMDVPSRRLVSALTWPVRRRFGYR